MARQTVKTKRTTKAKYRKSKAKPKHCPVCGKFMKRK